MTLSLKLLFAGALYLFGHLMRAGRLAILCLDDRKAMRRIVSVHLVTLWPSAIIPFKLGEAARLLGFIAVTKSRWIGCAIWLVERACDAVALILLISGLLVLGPTDIESKLLLGSLLLFVLLVVGGGWTLREVIPYLYDDLLLRSRSSGGVAGLRLVIQVRSAADQIANMLIGRVGLIILISFAIWACELAAVSLLISGSDLAAQIATQFSERLLHSTSGETLKEPILIGLTVVGAFSLAALVFARRRKNA